MTNKPDKPPPPAKNTTQIVIPQHDPKTGQFLPGNTAAINEQLPTIYRSSPEEIEKAVKEYLQECVDKSISATMPGLAYVLDFESRDGIAEALSKNPPLGMEQHKQSVALTIKKAKLFIESQHVQRMVDGKGSTVGAIFNLKCNHNYVETVHIQTDNRLHITWGSEERPALDITPEPEQIEGAADDS